jgi:Sec-independent protein translocase protein TatA
MNFGGVGGLELLVIMVVAMLVLGPSRMASTARTLGKVSRELRKGADVIPNFLEEIQGAPDRDEDDTPEEDDAAADAAAPPPGAQPRQRARRPSGGSGDAEKDPETGA